MIPLTKNCPKNNPLKISKKSKNSQKSQKLKIEIEIEFENN
jgi:hypothetical protein